MGLFKKSNRITLRVPDMSCGHCEAKVSDALGKLETVAAVKADSKKKRATLTLSGEKAPTQEEIQRALEGSGYSATIEN
ncbi:MAG: heavy-metal-associated domain-containing protein [Spirochaetales bacterium]